jgi:hypothetical protein
MAALRSWLKHLHRIFTFLWLKISWLVSMKLNQLTLFFQNPGGAKLEPIYPNQVKVAVKNEPYHEGKDLLKKIDPFL